MKQSHSNYRKSEPAHLGLRGKLLLQKMPSEFGLDLSPETIKYGTWQRLHMDNHAFDFDIHSSGIVLTADTHDHG